MPEAIGPAQEDAKAVLFWLGDQCCGVAAGRVARVIGAHPITKVPLFPPQIPGVVALSGKVVPVIELRRMLGLPEQEDGEFILVTIGAESYALRVDRVLRMSGFADGDQAVRHIDIGTLLGQSLPEPKGDVVPLASIELAERAPTAIDASNLGNRALAVETSTSRELIPLDVVLELNETLPLVAIPDPIFAGAVLHRGKLLPVISFDALVGGGAAKDHACHVIVDLDGRRCALAVKRIIGLSAETDRIVDLRPLLAGLLPEARAVAAPASARQVAGNAAEAPHLLVELAGRTCAFALHSVAHIHAGCRVLRVSEGNIGGVTAIGGRVLPIIDLERLLGIIAESDQQQFIELKSPDAETFVVAVDRVVGTVPIGQDALVRQTEGDVISAVAKLGPRLVWILAVPLIVEYGRARRDAA